MAILSSRLEEQPSVLRRIVDRLKHGELGPLPVLVGLIIVAIVFQTLNPNFLTPRNMSNLILQIGVVGTLASAVVLALLLGEIDLSLGAVAGVSAAVLGVVLTAYGWPGWLAIAAAIGAGALMGTLQGTIIVLLKVPSFIATLAGLLAWQGVQLILLGPTGERLIREPMVRAIASGYLPAPVGWIVGGLVVALTALLLIRQRARRASLSLAVEPMPVLAARIAGIGAIILIVVGLLNAYFGVPYILLLVGAIVLALTWFTERTQTGRHIYAIGGNAEAARRAGIPVAAIKIGIFALISALAGFAGVISASRQFAV